MTSHPTPRDWPNLVTMFFDQVAARGDRPFLWAKRDGPYQPMSWGDAAARVTPLARGLIAQGVGAGDRVVLVSESRPAWPIADIAIMSVGAITVPAYTTNTEADHLHILTDSGAKGAIVSTRRLAQRLLPAAAQAPELEFVVTLEDLEGAPPEGLRVIPMDDLLEVGRARRENIVDKAAALTRDDSACIIYTSGTGGVPKGVVLHHGAILHNCMAGVETLTELGLGDEVFLSFLPLSHSYEHTGGQFLPIAIGAEIYYAQGIESLASNMLEARPTIMMAVPRLYETLHHRITIGVKKAGGTKEKLFHKAYDLGRRRHETPAGLGLGDRLMDKAVDKLVRDKIRARFGGRLKALVSGGAPLNPEIGMFFTALGLRLLQGYGQTESAPLISVNRKNSMKLHTVGPPVADTEVRIADDGEILVRGELVMKGYWNNEEATSQAIQDGWLHTGDIGHLDEDGHLVITDRKKDIIVNSGGDNIAPQRIEGLLTVTPEIAQAMVAGDKRPHLVALVVPKDDWLTGWKRETGKKGDLASLADDADLHKALSDAISGVNKELSNIEKVRKFIVAQEPFTIDNELMTPTMKVRRHKVRDIYGDRLEALYR